MRPVCEGRLRVNLQNGLMEPEIVAVVRSQHQPVAREPDGIAISIFRRVDDFYSGHSLSYTNIKAPPVPSFERIDTMLGGLTPNKPWSTL